MQFFKEKLENEYYNSKINIKREYELSQKSNFDIWLDYFKSDLKSICNDILDIIDLSVKGPKKLSSKITLKRKNIVRDIIINHLDESYHKKILHESEPQEILKKLRGRS